MFISVSSAQPRVAIIPLRASNPTATFPGNSDAACFTKLGSSTATVPSITLDNPLLSQLSIVCRLLIPPPNCTGTSTDFKISSTGDELIGLPAKAPFKSTKCNHSHPSFANLIA